MSTTTPNLALTLYDASGDQAVTFATFRAVWGGTATTSNFYKIDTAWGLLDARIDSLELLRGAIDVSAGYVSANYYEANSITAITSYITNMTIILSLDTTSSGTVTLNINALGTKTLVKINAAGATTNLTNADLQIGYNYLFQYNGSQWVWVGATTADQIYISGTAGNLVKISSANRLEDSGVSATTISVLSQSVAFSGDISPSQITANQNDYNPSGLSTASTLRINSDAARDITGLQGGADGRIILVHNTGSFSITIKNSSASSSAANRFLLISDLILTSNMSVQFQYDSTSTKWRLVGGGSAGTDLSSIYALIA